MLLATLMRQAYTQWRTRATAGCSNGSSLGNARHRRLNGVRCLLHNCVYMSSNIATLLTALVGERLYVCNGRSAAGLANAQLDAR